MATHNYISQMAAKNQSGGGRNRTQTGRGHYRSATTGRFISASIVEKSGKSIKGTYRTSTSGLIHTVDLGSLPISKATLKGKPTAKATAGLKFRHGIGAPVVNAERVVALPRAQRTVRPYSKAEEEAVTRIARNAEAARRDRGENLTGLSDEEFLARLLG